MTALPQSLAQRFGAFAADAPHRAIPGGVVPLVRAEMERSTRASRAGDGAAAVAVADRAGGRSGVTYLAFRGAAAAYAAEVANRRGSAASPPDSNATRGPLLLAVRCVILPALRVVAADQSLDEAEMLAAGAVALEITARLHVALEAALIERRIPAYGVLGPIGAAVAVAQACGGTSTEIGNALAVAGSLASNVGELADDPSGAYLAGWAAQNGVLAGGLGIKGFVGQIEAFEGERGLFRAFAGDREGPARAALAGLGEQWLATSYY